MLVQRQEPEQQPVLALVDLLGPRLAQERLQVLAGQPWPVLAHRLAWVPLLASDRLQLRQLDLLLVSAQRMQLAHRLRLVLVLRRELARRQVLGSLRRPALVPPLVLVLHLRLALRLSPPLAVLQALDPLRQPALGCLKASLSDLHQALARRSRLAH